MKLNINSAKSFLCRAAKKFAAALKRFPAALRGFFSNLLEKYKYALYHGVTPESPLKNSRGLPRTASLAVFVILLTAALYVIGAVNLPFIPRSETVWENRLLLTEIASGKNKGGAENQGSADSSNNLNNSDNPGDSDNSGDSNNTDKSDSDGDRKTVKSIDLRNTIKNIVKFAAPREIRPADELVSEGYYLTDKTYSSDSCVIGKITFDFSFPSKFSYGNMKKRTWVVTEYDDGRMSTVSDTETTVPRPAVYLYMGYIIYNDAGHGLYLMDSGGNILMNYDRNYIPAFARSPDGRPLFYSTYSYYAETPDAMETDESGVETPSALGGVNLTGRKYFALSPSGTYFTEVDYTEERDGRGLNFDFTSSFGAPTSPLLRVGIVSPKLSTYLDGSRALTNFTRWNYFLKDDPFMPNLEEIALAEAEYEALGVDERLALIENKQTPSDIYSTDTLLPYSAAFNYSEDYAVVVTDDTGEDAKYETEEVRVINTYGEMMFASKKEYYNTDLKDYCSDRYLLPLSRGEESVGHLYFSNGLLRLRKVSFDQYQLDEFGDLRINSDRDVLVYPNGREFPIPDGYELRGYSDGVLLLERNGLYGYFTIDGRWIADPEYTEGHPFFGGIGILKSKSGKYFALDTSGKLVIPAVYTYMQSRSDGLIAAYSESTGWELFGVYTAW